MVDHELLLKKLEAYGIVNTELKWCRSYLTGRKQVVHLSGKESRGAPMKHGIPQGSILGPLFFILFINDLPLHVSSQVDLYAVDAASALFNKFLELKLSLNISANEICHWADSNKLPINKSKAKVLTITRKCLASNINDELVVHSNLLSATRKLRSFPTRNCKSDCEMRVIYTKSGNYNSLNVLTETIRRKIVCNIFDEHQPVI